MDAAIEKALREQFEQLTLRQQRQVLAYARALAAAPDSAGSGTNLTRFAGTIDPADLARIAAAIDADCEHVDRDEW